MVLALTSAGRDIVRGGRAPAPPPSAPVVAPPRPPVTVHLFSDISCPWCWVGKQRLDRAIRQYKRKHGAQSTLVNLAWNPLLTSTEVSPKGEDVASWASRRTGGDSSQFLRTLRRSGLPDGAPFGNWQTVPNSLGAHQLIMLASEYGLAEAAIDKLFSRTYEQGANVGRLDELLSVGEELNLPRQRLYEVLGGSGSGAAPLLQSVLDRDLAAKQRLRITKVPYYIITAGPNSRTKYSLSGAQEPSELLGAIERVASEETRLAYAARAGTYADLLTSASGSFDAVMAAAQQQVAPAKERSLVPA